MREQADYVLVSPDSPQYLSGVAFLKRINSEVIRRIGSGKPPQEGAVTIKTDLDAQIMLFATQADEMTAIVDSAFVIVRNFGRDLELKRIFKNKIRSRIPGVEVVIHPHSPDFGKGRLIRGEDLLKRKGAVLGVAGNEVADSDLDIILKRIPPELSRRKEDYKSFRERLRQLPNKEQWLISLAYNLAKAAHRTTPPRLDGERHFEHVRGAALILMDECQIYDWETIVAALLHDAVEDTKMFGSYEGQPYEEWVEEVGFQISTIFGENVAEIVIALSKPKPDGRTIIGEEGALKRYYENLRTASAKAILVKMADRLHNLRTIRALDRQRQLGKVRETKEIYMPIFQKALKEYPDEMSYLINQMNVVMDQIERGEFGKRS